MRVRDLHDKEGFLFAFEVDNTLLGRRGALRVIRTIPNVKIITTPKALSWLREEVFCTFEVSGRKFLIEEPWGDSSDYWIGPDEPIERTEQICEIRSAFEKAGPLGYRWGGG